MCIYVLEIPITVPNIYLHWLFDLTQSFYNGQ